MSLLKHPFMPLAMLAVAVLALLSLPLRLPIGPNYWDLYTYVDTAYRMNLGQIPHVDFFVPVGSLGYALYAFVAKAFPAGQTLLAVQYAILIVALPLMAVVVHDAARRSRAEALALAIPFVIFALIPINGQALYPSPGFDGYGNYNRHIALLLYVLSANLLFVENRAKAAVIAVLLLAAMFMVKVTGFVVGALLVAHALLAGRLSLRWGAIIAAAVGLGLGILQWRTGLVSAYVADIAGLVGANTGSLLPRIFTVLSTKLDVIAPASALVLALCWRTRADWMPDAKAAITERSLAAVYNLLNADWLWLLSLLLAGAIFETQNTGSHEFILIWPALLRLFRTVPLSLEPRHAALLALIAATALPTPVSVIHRAARAIASAPGYESVSAPLLGPFGRVSGKREIMQQSRALLAHYPAERAAYESFARQNVLPSYIMFSEIDFQVSWLVSTQQAAEAILAYEKADNRVFKRIVTFDFVDPLPAILGREPLKDLSIGNDPERTLMKLDARAKAEIASADAVLLPLCPVLNSRIAIANAYAPLLQGRRLVALTPCFNMLVRE
jgi:hypothetical protein